MADFDYDLFVIGGGSGGVRAARIAAGHGARVALAEEFRVGGTCVIRGCVPKKLLVYASRFADDFRDAAGFGWSVGKPRFNWSDLIAAKDAEIGRLEKIYRANLGSAGVAIIDSRATVTGPHEVNIAVSGTRVSARHILVSTGAWPNFGEAFPGIEHAITSNEMFDLKEQPERLVVVGGGYIAVEFASLMNGLGTKTTLIYRGPQILRGFDDDIRAHVADAMRARGIDIICNDRLAAIDKTGEGLTVATREGRQIGADQLLFAIGRAPHTRGLGLEEAGVKLDAAGAVIVDDYSATNIPSIHAVGDVTDRVALTPVAIREGHAFADTVFGGKKRKVDHDLIPTAVFTTPEIGVIGLTETEAKERCASLDIYRTSFRSMRATLAGGDEKVLMKLIVDAETDRVIGCHIVGDAAGEMIQLIGIAIGMKATKADFDATMAVHPTAAEELVTLREPSERWRADVA
ncbi:MAG: glutathione-disulfide reductase [Flavobacteriaceae bacterium]